MVDPIAARPLRAPLRAPEAAVTAWLNCCPSATIEKNPIVILDTSTMYFYNLQAKISLNEARDPPRVPSPPRTAAKPWLRRC